MRGFVGPLVRPLVHPLVSHTQVVAIELKTRKTRILDATVGIVCT